MVLRVGVAVLALLVCLTIPAAGQPTAGTVLEDPAGDVRSEVADTPGPSPPVYSIVDLRSLSLEETRSAFTFRLAAEALPSGNDPAVDGAVYDIAFVHNGRQFVIEVVMILPAVEDQVFAALAYRDGPEEAWSTIWVSEGGALVDRGANTLIVEVARDHLADADGTAPVPGRSLDGMQAWARTGASIAGLTVDDTDYRAPVSVLDDMPNPGGALGAWSVRIGEAQTGHAFLKSRQPFRASNGEATTFVYEVQAHNLRQSADTFELSVRDVPPGYTAVLPVPVVALQGGTSTSVPVLLTLPFGHQHGAAVSFVLEMHSLSDPGAVGRLQMGVRYLDVPQPAGHHDTVYLHLGPQMGGIGPAFGFQIGFMNTLEEDPNDVGGNHPSSGLSLHEPGAWGTSWTYGLSPALLLGMDVDPAKVGRLSLPVGSPILLRETSLSATLYVGNRLLDEDATVLARMPPTDPVDLMPNSVALVQGDLLPEQDVEPLAYVAGTNLWLDIELRTSGPVMGLNFGPDSPYLAPGGFAHLPLREWHDPVDEALAVTGGPALTALGPQERQVNPGEAAVFPISVANPLDEAVTVRFEVSGANADWASLPTGSVSVPPHGTAQISVVVRAPQDSLDRHRADLVLQAYTEDRPDLRGLLRLVAEVDTTQDHVDDSALAGGLGHKESPAPGAGLLLGLLAILALGRRRPSSGG